MAATRNGGGLVISTWGDEREEEDTYYLSPVDLAEERLGHDVGGAVRAGTATA